MDNHSPPMIESAYSGGNQTNMTELRDSTGNLTGVGNATGDSTRLNWIPIRIPTVVFLLFTSYAAVMLIFAERKRQMSRGEGKTPQWIAARLFAAFFLAFSYLCCIGTLFVEGDELASCDALMKFENTLYWFSLSTVYAAIWFRQKLIYDNYSMREGPSKCALCLSWLGAFLIVALPIVNSIIFISYMHFDTDKHCEAGVFDNVPVFIAIEVSGPLVMQFILLGLFIWPLIRHSRNIDQTIGLPRSTRTLMCRMILATFCCAVTDMLCTLSPLYLPVVYSRFVTQQTSSVLNFLFLMLSFRNWRILLFPYFVRRKSQQPSISAKTQHIAAS